MPMSDAQFEKIVKLTQAKREGGEEEDDEDAPAGFAVDEMVEVCEGPFKGMQGPVLETPPASGEEDGVATLSPAAVQAGRVDSIKSSIPTCVPTSVTNEMSGGTRVTS